MKKTKVFTSITAVILAAVLLFVTIVTINNNTKVANADTAEASVRTVELSKSVLDDQDLVNYFDEFYLNDTDSGFDLIAKKSFDLSIFSELDLIDLDELENQVTVEYELQYIESEDTIFLSAIIESEDEIPIVETIPGLVTYNSIGEPDVIFVVDDEYIWLSDLQDTSVIEETGFFSSLLKKVTSVTKSVVNSVVKAVVTVLSPAIRICTNVAVALLGPTAANIGATLLNMSEEMDENGNGTGIYHANFDCWQQYFGYIDLYDIVFDAATSMRSEKFKFDIDSDGVDDYILWAWKGDYLNLGAGAELGIYKRWKYADDIWQVDKSLAMKMTLQVDYNGENIINWQPTEKQWWITGFNCNYQNKNRDSLTATFTVTFNNSTMYNAFKNKWNKADSRWVFSSSYNAAFSF